VVPNILKEHVAAVFQS